jgi:hypothetical protein
MTINLESGDIYGLTAGKWLCEEHRDIIKKSVEYLLNNPGVKMDFMQGEKYAILFIGK